MIGRESQSDELEGTGQSVGRNGGQLVVVWRRMARDRMTYKGEVEGLATAAAYQQCE